MNDNSSQLFDGQTFLDLQCNLWPSELMDFKGSGVELPSDGEVFH